MIEKGNKCFISALFFFSIFIAFKYKVWFRFRVTLKQSKPITLFYFRFVSCVKRLDSLCSPGEPDALCAASRSVASVLARWEYLWSTCPICLYQLWLLTIKLLLCQDLRRLWRQEELHLWARCHLFLLNLVH